MSFQSTAWLCQPGIATNSTEYAVLAVLAHHADADGRRAFPSQSTIASIIARSPRTVRRCLMDLEQRGVIRRGDQSAVAHFPHGVQPVVWELVHEWTPDMADDTRPETSGHQCPPPPATSDRTPGHQCPPPPVTSDRQSIHHHPFNNQREGGSQRKAPHGASSLSGKLAESDLSWTSPDNPRCRKHAHLAAHEFRPCGACGAVRREFERRHATAGAVEQGARSARRDAIAGCPACDDYGMIQVGRNAVVKCDHGGGEKPPAGGGGFAPEVVEFVRSGGFTSPNTGTVASGARGGVRLES